MWFPRSIGELGFPQKPFTQLESKKFSEVLYEKKVISLANRLANRLAFVGWYGRRCARVMAALLLPPPRPPPPPAAAAAVAAAALAAAALAVTTLAAAALANALAAATHLPQPAQHRRQDIWR